MSLFKYMFDHDLLQRQDIEQLRRNARRDQRRGRRKDSESRQRLEELEDQVGELTLLCQALLSVLRDSGQLDPQALQAALERIDAEDGVIDGQVTPEQERPGTRTKQEAPVRRSRRH